LGAQIILYTETELGEMTYKGLIMAEPTNNIPKAHPKIVGQAKKRVRSKKNAIRNKRSKGPIGIPKK